MSLNLFDIAMLALVAVSAITGFMSGMLRSIASVIAYLGATALALYAAPFVSPYVGPYVPQPWLRDVAAFLIVFFGGVLILGFLLQAFVSMIFGPAVSFGDRFMGFVLGIVRAGLVVILIVLVFDRTIPRASEPWWLQGSQVRPYAQTAGAHILRSLPANLAAAIERVRAGVRP